MSSRDIIPLTMPMAPLAESKAGFCSGISCLFGNETFSQFCSGRWDGTFDGALCWILDGTGC